MYQKKEYYAFGIPFIATRLVFLTTALLLLFACSNYEGKIVGRWQWQDGQIAEYMKDGTAAWSSGSVNVAGNWSISDGKLMINKSGLQFMFRIEEITKTSIKLNQIPDGKIWTAVRL